MPGTVLLLAAAPVGKGCLVDAASVLPVLAAVSPAVLSGTDTANVVELADPLEPQAVLTRLRAAATAPGPLTVFVTGQLLLDRRQHLPHLALARTTTSTARYTAFPWHWIREELRLRTPGSTALFLDLHADAETWAWLRTHPLDCGRGIAVYGRIAPPPSRRMVAAPAYMKAIATILRSGRRPDLMELHQQALARLGSEAYGDIVVTVTGVGVGVPPTVAGVGTAAGPVVAGADVAGASVVYGAGVGVPPTVAGVGTAAGPVAAGAGVADAPVVYGAGVVVPPTVPGGGVAVRPKGTGAGVADRTAGPGAGDVAASPTVPGARAGVPSAGPGADVGVPARAREADDRTAVLGAGDVADRTAVLEAGDVAASPTVPGARAGVPSAGPGADVGVPARAREVDVAVPPAGPGTDVAVPPTVPVVAVPLPEASVPRSPRPPERSRSQTPDAPNAADRRPESDDDPHAYITAAVQAGRHSDADALAAEHEQAAVRAHGPGSEQALHWAEVRADLAMFAGDPVRSCRTWLGVAGARLTAGQTPDSAAVEAAVDRAHHQWSQIRDLEAARELGSLLAELRGRVPGRRQGALENINRQLRQLQTQS